MTDIQIDTEHFQQLCDAEDAAKKTFFAARGVTLNADGSIPDDVDNEGETK